MEAASRLTLQSAPKLLQPRFEVGFSMQVIRRTPLEVSSSQMFYCALQPLVRNVVPVGMQPRCRPVGYLLPRSCSIDQSKQLFFDVIPTRPGIRTCQCKSCAKFFQPVLKVRLSMEVGRRTSLEIGTRKYADGVPNVRIVNSRMVGNHPRHGLVGDLLCCRAASYQLDQPIFHFFAGRRWRRLRRYQSALQFILGRRDGGRQERVQTQRNAPPGKDSQQRVNLSCFVASAVGKASHR